MKRGIITIGVLTLLFLNSTWGQPTSRIRSYSETTVSDVHLQVYKSTFSTLLYYKESATNRNIFIFRNKKYTLPILTNTYGEISYSVNDMKVAGDCCFFCGRIVIPTEPPLPPPIIDRSSGFYEKGYIACLYLDSIDNPYNPNVRCRFSLIEGTYEMTKMAIYSYSNDTAIALIGKYGNPDHTSCLVSVTSSGSSWQNNVYYFTDTTETLTDITLTDKCLVTASRFGGETTTFGVRYVNLYDFFYSTNITDYTSLNKFDTHNLLTNPPSPPATAWHRNDATIRIVAVPSSNNVIIGQECHYFNGPPGSISSYINLYQIDGNNPYNIFMTKAHRTFCVPTFPDVFYDMQYIPSINKIAILQKHPNTNFNYTGTLNIVSLYSNTQEYYSSNYIIMSSMDITANKYVWIGGINMGNNTIVQTCQDITAHLNSCHPIGSSNITNLTPLPNNIQSTTTIKMIVNPMLWRYKSRDVPAITHYDIPCIRPLED